MCTSLHVNCWGDKIQEGETGAACSRRGRYKKIHKNVKRNSSKRECLGELRADWRIISKVIRRIRMQGYILD
jgi:hypothetical protein